MNLIHLYITSFIGVSPGAVHYYGSLKSKKSIELKKKVKQSDLKALNGSHPTYRVGNITTRFNSEKEIIRLAIKTYKEHFKNATVLCLGNTTFIEPKKILDAPKGVKTKANALYRKADKLGMWENKNKDDEMEKLTKEWYEIVEGKYPYENFTNRS